MTQSIKETPRGWTNLRVGEPQFLWPIYGPLAKFRGGRQRFGYPGLKPEKSLMNQLQKLHPNKYVVVANGARHALYAGINSLDAYRIEARPPFWPGLRDLSEISRIPLNSNRKSVASPVTIATVPNNPDGFEFYGKYADIVDCAYYSNIYNATCLPLPEHRISVWSASKLYGWAGARIGWLVTSEKELAEKAAAYVEATTSGVCLSAQAAVAEVIKQDDSRLQSYGQEILFENRDLLHKALGDYFDDVTNFNVNGGVGMFAWLYVDDVESWNRALHRARVLDTDGTCFGSDPNYRRLSLGLDPKTFRIAIERIKKGFDA